jgi:hypothetical protein
MNERKAQSSGQQWCNWFGLNLNLTHW